MRISPRILTECWRICVCTRLRRCQEQPAVVCACRLAVDRTFALFEVKLDAGMRKEGQVK